MSRMPSIGGEGNIPSSTEYSSKSLFLSVLRGVCLPIILVAGPVIALVGMVISLIKNVIHRDQSKREYNQKLLEKAGKEEVSSSEEMTILNAEISVLEKAIDNGSVQIHRDLKKWGKRAIPFLYGFEIIQDLFCETCIEGPSRPASERSVSREKIAESRARVDSRGPTPPGGGDRVRIEKAPLPSQDEESLEEGLAETNLDEPTYQKPVRKKSTSKSHYVDVTSGKEGRLQMPDADKRVQQERKEEKPLHQPSSDLGTEEEWEALDITPEEAAKVPSSSTLTEQARDLVGKAKDMLTQVMPELNLGVILPEQQQATEERTTTPKSEKSPLGTSQKKPIDGKSSPVQSRKSSSPDSLIGREWEEVSSTEADDMPSPPPGVTEQAFELMGQAKDMLSQVVSELGMGQEVPKQKKKPSKETAASLNLEEIDEESFEKITPTPEEKTEMELHMPASEVGASGILDQVTGVIGSVAAQLPGMSMLSSKETKERDDAVQRAIETMLSDVEAKQSSSAETSFILQGRAALTVKNLMRYNPNLGQEIDSYRTEAIALSHRTDVTLQEKEELKQCWLELVKDFSKVPITSGGTGMRHLEEALKKIKARLEENSAGN